MRKVVGGILYVLATGCQWKAMPKQFGSGSAIHSYFQDWVERGVFEELWQLALAEYDFLRGIDWRWQSLDGATVKSPLGGIKTGKNPTDRGKLGVKRSTLVDGRGVPLTMTIDRANAHDSKLLAATLDAIPIERPKPTAESPQHLCLDKGYVGKPVDREARQRGYLPHVPRKGNQSSKPKRCPGKALPGKALPGKARRWKVERTHSWLNRTRRLLIRWKKKADNDLAFLQLRAAIITLKACRVLDRL